MTQEGRLRIIPKDVSILNLSQNKGVQNLSAPLLFRRIGIITLVVTVLEFNS